MNDDTVRLTASELIRRNAEYWTQKDEELRNNPEKRLDLAFLAACLGDTNAKDALLHFARLGLWADKYRKEITEMLARGCNSSEYTDYDLKREALAALKAVGVEV